MRSEWRRSPWATITFLVGQQDITHPEAAVRSVNPLYWNPEP
jgi:hypothetical protein